MGGLALATLTRAGAGPLSVANRDAARAARTAQLHGARAVPFADIAAELARVDLVLCATASTEPVLDLDLVGAAVAGRAGRPLVIFDLAVPRDVAAEVGTLPGVTLIDVAAVGAATLDAPSQADRVASEAIVAAEVEAFLSWLRGADVVPTVAALRARADEVVAGELRRLRQRRPDLTDEQRADVALAVHRVVQQLLHQPTVRVRQLAATPGGDQYVSVLRELFDLAVPDVTEGLDRAVEVAPEEPGADA